MPKALYKSGTKACITISIIVTKVAIITIKTGMRMILGTILRIDEIITLLNVKTKVKAKPIANPFIAEEVTAKVGHIPKTNTNTGFSFNIPFEKFCH
jgi:hypothetical protein